MRGSSTLTARNKQRLTNVDEIDGFSLCKLQGSDPSLSFHFTAGFEVECLRASVTDDEATRVLRVYERIRQVDGATASVRHLSLVSKDKKTKLIIVSSRD